MKHIKKKLAAPMLAKDLENRAGFDMYRDAEGIKNALKSKKKSDFIFLETYNGDAAGGILYNINGKDIFLPAVDPCLIYFNSAQSLLGEIDSLNKDIIKNFNIDNIMGTEANLYDVYRYFGVISNFILITFGALEAFVNSQIPEAYIYRRSSNKSTELFNKNQIQRYLPFDEKLKKVLKDATGSDFFKKSTPANQMLHNLKQFRDDIMHTKTESDNLMIRHKDLINMALKFNYQKSLESVAKFVNFYKPNYIEKCDCGADY